MSVILLALSSPVFSQTNALPNLDTFTVNKTEEMQLGKQFLRQLRASTPTLSDPLIQNYLESLCYRLSFAAQSDNQQLQIVLLPDHQINAFAVAGGVIGINTGLLSYAENEGELAAVLSHEIAHLDQHHYLRAQDSQQQDQWLYLGTLLASIVLAAHSSSNDAGLALGLSTQAAMIDKQLRYSRLHEREADHIGMQTLVNAGFNAQAMANFFTKLDQQSRIVGLMPEFLLTHPLTQDRIADSTLRAQQLSTKGELNSLDYQLVRTRLMAILHAKDPAQLQHYQQQLITNPQDEVGQLGVVFALLNSEKYSEARLAIAKLRKQSPQRIDYIIAQADIELADHQPAMALTILEEALLISPNNDTLRFYAARAAMKNQQYTKATHWFNSLAYERPDDISVWQNLIECYQAQKDGLSLLRAQAEQSYLIGDFDKAIRSLEQAKKLAAQNYPLLAKIKTRQEWFVYTKNTSRPLK